MPIPRRNLIDPDTPGFYHLISRCVRRAFLCGEDPDTGISYEHRRHWIENRILELATIFSINVYAYAVMSNHYHLVVYSDPKAPEKWSDWDVANRWLKAYPGKLDSPKYKLQRELKLQAIMADKSLLKLYRQRLGSLSWLMRRLNEPMAKAANREDCCKGHFWESRFTSQSLLDESAALTCMAYVDLNPIRTGNCQTLEDSHHTSIKKRVKRLSAEDLEKAVKAISGQLKSNHLSINLTEYIELVEWTGKSLIYPNKASMPLHIKSTLSQFNINHKHWLSQVTFYGSHFGAFVGCAQAVKTKAEELEKKWLKGLTKLQQLFVTA